MKKEIIRQQVRITKTKIDKDETTAVIGEITIERRFKIFSDGNCKLDNFYPEKLIAVNGTPVDFFLSLTILEEFFPGFTGYETEDLSNMR